MVPAASHAQTIQDSANNLNVGFSATGYTGLTATDTLVPYVSTFNAASSSYYSTNSLTQPVPGLCEAYVSADVGLAPSGTFGVATDVGSRAWFEAWLTQLGVAQQTDPTICNHVLVVFKMFPASSRSSSGGAGNIGVANNAGTNGLASGTYPPALGGTVSLNGGPANLSANPGQIQQWQALFLGIDWQTVTGWHGKFDFIPWNDYASYSGEGDGYAGATSTFVPGGAFTQTGQLPYVAKYAAAMYIALHLLCDSGTSVGDPYGVCGNVVAGGFSDNTMNCTDHTSSSIASGTCSDGATTATFLDQYLYYIYVASQETVTPTGSACTNMGGGASGNTAADPLCTGTSAAQIYIYPIENHPFPAGWKPEAFAFKDFADVNNYISNYGTAAGQCLDATTCLARSVAKTFAADPLMKNTEIWNMATAAGQLGVTTSSLGSDNTYWKFVPNSVTDPTPIQQACAASFLLNLTSSLGPQFTRLYYEGAAWDANITGTGSNGNWSLFPKGDDGTSVTTAKPALSVLANRNLAYNSSCPGGLPTQLVNISDPASQTHTDPGVFDAPIQAQAQDSYGNAYAGVAVTFGPVTGLSFSQTSDGVFTATLGVTADASGNTPAVYVKAQYVRAYTAIATLDGAPGTTPAQFSLTIEGSGPPPPPDAEYLTISAVPDPPVAGSQVTLSVQLPDDATGTVSFTYNGGSPLVCNEANPVPVEPDGTATCTAMLPANVTSIEGEYTAPSDALYSSSALTPITEVTAAADFTITLTPPTQTVAPGTPAVYAVNLVVSNGPYNCPVNLTALLSTSIPNATLVFDQSSLTPGSGATTNLTVTVPQQTAKLTGLGAKAPLMLAALLLPLAAWRRRQSLGKLLLVLVLMLAASAAVIGCGGGDNNNGSTAAPSNYKITITGNGTCGSGALRNANAFLVVSQ
ncbi:MAG: hypothetical protein FWD64_03400 [Acidobacteriaceae bacterium]|nr:hypothetical protein [Acidobacteriaceae bacterium]